MVTEYIAAAKRDDDEVKRFVEHLCYVTIDATGENGWPELSEADPQGRGSGLLLLCRPIALRCDCRTAPPSRIANRESRIVVEKPFGRDLATAHELNETLAAHFTEHQIYRIDHYLGKETVQNLMAVRFANILFEPLWNARHVDHVQITVAETVGVGGRGAYYDKSGAMRDMVQNHMMQLLCLIAMEPPYRFDPDAVRDEKLKVIRALEPVGPEDIVRGQYRATDERRAYRRRCRKSASTTESYIALKVDIANWRWKGTPFYLRTGKKLRARDLGNCRGLQGGPAFDLRRRRGLARKRADDPPAAERGHEPVR